MAKSRADLRAAIFSGDNMKPKTMPIKFFGEDIEVRQPNVSTVLDFRNAADTDRKSAMVDMIIAYCFVPGTDEKVFEDADKDNLVQMPFGSDFTRLQQAISELTNVKLATEEAAKNSDGTASSTTS